MQNRKCRLSDKNSGFAVSSAHRKCGRTLRGFAALIAAIAVLALGGCDLITPEIEAPAAPDRTAPAEVSNLVASSENGQVVLTWTNPVGTDFDRVVITYTVNGTPQTIYIAKGTQTATIIGPVDTFTLKTVDLAGNVSAGTTEKQATTVTGVTVSPVGVSVITGTTQSFTASVVGTNNPHQTVTWSIDETDKKPGTTIDTNGLLTVALDEALTSLTVRATSTVDNTKSGKASVTIVPDITAPAEVGNLIAIAGDTRVILDWTDTTDRDFANVVITYADGTAPAVTVPKGRKTATITGLTNGMEYTFTVQTVDTTGNISTGTTQKETPVRYKVVDRANPDLTIKFGKRTSVSVPLTQSMVSETFISLHNLISTSPKKENLTDIIHLGDYIDLPSLAISGSGPIIDKELSGHGRLLRLMVVGINLFKRDGAAANNPNAPDHVVFQFQNIPVNHNMNSYRAPMPSLSGTSAGGYAASGMRTYLTGPFLTGLKNASGLTDKMLWGPARKVANGGYYATGTNTIQDTLWLPTEWEMTGIQGRSGLSPYEPGAPQVRLEYNSTRVKYDWTNTAQRYWLASAQWNAAWRLYNGNGLDNNESYVQHGCVPAFCVR